MNKECVLSRNVIFIREALTIFLEDAASASYLG